MPIGVPHFVNIKLKPDKSIEVQTSACSKSSISCQMRHIKSITEMKQINFAYSIKKSEQAGTSTVKQLTAPNHIAVGVSAFASEAIAIEVHKARLGFVRIF